MSAFVKGDVFEVLNFFQTPEVKLTPPGPKAKAMLDRQAKVDSRVLFYPHILSDYYA
jgi:hypothetical protein